MDTRTLQKSPDATTLNHIAHASLRGPCNSLRCSQLYTLQRKQPLHGLLPPHSWSIPHRTVDHLYPSHSTNSRLMPPVCLSAVDAPQRHSARSSPFPWHHARANPARIFLTSGYIWPSWIDETLAHAVRDALRLELGTLRPLSQSQHTALCTRGVVQCMGGS